MANISVEVSDELAKRLSPLKDRLPEIIELGLKQIESSFEKEPDLMKLKKEALAKLHQTGIVTIPDLAKSSSSRTRHTPIDAGGLPASAIIIKNRR